MKRNDIDIRDIVVFEEHVGKVIGLNYLTETATIEIYPTGSRRTNVPIDDLAVFEGVGEEE